MWQTGCRMEDNIAAKEGGMVVAWRDEGWQMAELFAGR